jgi:hypothetical protein
MGRTLPALAHLHDERNALKQRVVALEQDQANLRGELKQYREHFEYMSGRREQGFLVEFDYGYTPKVRDWDSSLGGNFCGRLIAARTESYSERLASMLACKDALRTISADEPVDEREPFWNQTWFPALDAICLTGLLVSLNPRRYVEVGSGNSTKFARRAVVDHGLRTEIISIDPHPRAVIDSLCDRVIRKELEQCELDIFSDLGADDLLFIDNSHRSFQNSDVTVFFTEILPLLRSGCHYGIHDIFLPNDYPASWLSRFYNEQYLLMAYLIGGAGGDQIVLPVHFVQRTRELLTILDPIIRDPALGGAPPYGGAFWMVKG